MAGKPVTEPVVGQYVAAKYEADQRWYRAVIETVCGGGKASVFFIDYGNRYVSLFALLC